MKTTNVTTLPMQTVAISREGSSYAVSGQTFNIWSPCGKHNKHEAFEGWDG